jgi:hypothetical protein
VARLGRQDLTTRHGAFDSEHPAVEIVDPQRSELTTTRPAVRGEPDHQQVQLGTVVTHQARSAFWLAGCRRLEPVLRGRSQQPADVLVAERSARWTSCWAAEEPQRMSIDDALVVAPAQR